MSVDFILAKGEGKNAKVFRDYSNTTKIPKSKSQAKNKPTTTEVKTEEIGHGDWIPWGLDDRRPTTIREKIEDSGVPAAALWKKTALMYGQGLIWFDPADGVDGGVVPQYDEEIERFMFRNRILDFFLPAIMYDFETYDGNFFCEIGFDKGKEKITNIWHKDAEFSRLYAPKQSQLATQLVYSAKFPGATSGDVARIPLLNPFNPLRTIESLSKKKFAFHGHMPKRGKVFYSTSPKSGVFKDDGWLDYTNRTPSILKAMQENQIVLQYLIRIPVSYFKLKYNGSSGNDKQWDEFTHAEQEVAIETKRSEIERFLVGKENWFKSLTTIFFEDIESGTTGAKIEIESIDNTYKDGIWIPDVNAALTIVLQSLGLPPELMSLSNSDKVKPESGSNKRVAFNTGVQTNTIEQNIILYIFNLIAYINGWKLRAAFRHSMLTTVDFSKSGVQDEGMV